MQETEEDPPSEKPKVGNEEQRDEGEEQPIQETQGPGMKGSNQVKGDEEDCEDVLEGQPLQESSSPDVENDCIKD